MDNQISDERSNQELSKQKTISILSWNVNGIRSAHRKGFSDWLTNVLPDILCLQEVRAKESQIEDDVAHPSGYYAYWNCARKPGYGGTGLLSRCKPVKVDMGLGNEKFDSEGRVIIAFFDDFVLINCYFPNGNRSEERLHFKLEFYKFFLQKVLDLRQQGYTVVFCGDLNTAHKEVDLANPQANKMKSGFLPQERSWIDHIINTGYLDSFRYFHPDLPNMYTWWSYLPNSRELNIGWRFDYFFIPKDKLERTADTFIMSEVTLSDHCPIGILWNTLHWKEKQILPKLEVNQLSLF